MREKDRPIERSGRCPRLGRRYRLEADQAAQRVELDSDHAGQQRRRIRFRHRDDTGVVATESLRDEQGRTLTVPEVDRRRTPVLHVLPAGLRLVVLLNPTPVFTVPGKAPSGVERFLRVAEPPGDLLRFLDERVRRFLQRHVPMAVGTRREIRGEREAAEDQKQTSPRRRGLHAFVAARRSDHFGRWRLAGGDRSGERVASRKRGRHGRDGARPGLRILLEAAQDDALDRGIQARRHGRRGGRRLFAVLAPPIGEVGCLECLAPGEDLVEHEPERVDVALDGSAFAGKLLRRHVGRRSRNFRAALVVFDAGREPEVRDLRAAAAVDHDVGRLQVSMQHALVVRRREPGAELARDLDRLVLRKPPDAPQERRQVLAVDVLHREEVPSLDLADVVDAADVRMRDAARVAHLGVEAFDPGGLRRQLFRQELQGDRLPEFQIVGAVDLAHASAADEPDDAETLAEDGPGRESAAIERWGGGETTDRAIRRAPPERGLRGRRGRQARRHL